MQFLVHELTVLRAHRRHGGGRGGRGGQGQGRQGQGRQGQGRQGQGQGRPAEVSQESQVQAAAQQGGLFDPNENSGVGVVFGLLGIPTSSFTSGAK